jgi:hypothetical protein
MKSGLVMMSQMLVSKEEQFPVHCRLEAAGSHTHNYLYYWLVMVLSEVCLSSPPDDVPGSFKRDR